MLKESVYACNNEKSRVIVAKLVKDVDLVSAIEILCEKYSFKSALLMVCFGSLGNIGFEVIAEDKNDPLGANLGAPLQLAGPIQLLTAQGTVSFEEKIDKPIAHIHAVFGDKNSIIHGGHLLRGKCPVLRTMEIAIQEVIGINMCRRFNPRTNSVQLMIEALPGH